MRASNLFYGQPGLLPKRAPQFFGVLGLWFLLGWSGLTTLSLAEEPTSQPDVTAKIIVSEERREGDTPQAAVTPEAADEQSSPRDTEPDIVTLRDEEALNAVRLDIPTLIQMVAERNLDVAIAGTQVEQAKGYRNQSFSELFPSIRSYNYVEKLKGGEIFIGPIPFDVDRVTYQGRIVADYQISLGGRTIYSILAATFQLNRIQLALKRTFQNALLETLTQYYTLLRDTVTVEVAYQSLKEADAQLAFNEARYRAGFGTLLDVTQSKVLQAERKNDVLKAENQRQVAMIQLASLLDLPMLTKIELDRAELVPLAFMDDSLTLSQLYQAALENRMDVKELTLQIKEAKARYGVTRSDLFPTLSLSGYKRRLGPNLDETEPSTNLNASISIDFLRNLGWNTLSMMQVQKGRVQEALLNKEKQLNSIQEELAKAYHESNLYRAQRDVALQKMNAALESYRIAGSRLKHGVGLNLDVVQAQKDLTDARLEYQNAVMNYNIAQIKLLYETGQLQPQLLQYGILHQPVSPPQVPAASSSQASLPSVSLPNVVSTTTQP